MKKVCLVIGAGIGGSVGRKFAREGYHAARGVPVAQQHRSTWTHELDLRSYSDLAWSNHAPKAFSGYGHSGAQHPVAARLHYPARVDHTACSRCYP